MINEEEKDGTTDDQWRGEGLEKGRAMKRRKMWERMSNEEEKDGKKEY